MTPHAAVTFFDEGLSFQVAGKGDCSQLPTGIDRVLPGHQSIYAIKVIREFALAETGSVPKQARPSSR